MYAHFSRELSWPLSRGPPLPPETSPRDRATLRGSGRAMNSREFCIKDARPGAGMQRESANASFGINPTSRRSHVPSSVGEIEATDFPRSASTMTRPTVVAVPGSKFARLVAVAARNMEKRNTRTTETAGVTSLRFSAVRVLSIDFRSIF